MLEIFKLKILHLQDLQLLDFIIELKANVKSSKENFCCDVVKLLRTKFI